MPKRPPPAGIYRYAARTAALLIAAALPAACAVPPPPPINPFAGGWSNPERHEIAFRDDTIVQQPVGTRPTAMGRDTCPRAFGFGYERKSRDALLALVPRQPDVRRRLAALLPAPDYPVAELRCDSGDTTYVLLDADHVLAVYRDGDIAGIEQLSRLPATAGAR